MKVRLEDKEILITLNKKEDKEIYSVCTKKDDLKKYIKHIFDQELELNQLFVEDEQYQTLDEYKEIYEKKNLDELKKEKEALIEDIKDHLDYIRHAIDHGDFVFTIEIGPCSYDLPISDLIRNIKMQNDRLVIINQVISQSEAN